MPNNATYEQLNESMNKWILVKNSLKEKLQSAEIKQWRKELKQANKNIAGKRIKMRKLIRQAKG